MASIPRISSLYYPVKEQVVDLYLRTVRTLADRHGKTLNVNVGSDYWLRANALANQIVPAFANNKIALQQYSPSTSTGDKLTELAAERGVAARPGAQAQGSVTVSCSTTVVIPAGFVATSPAGVKYETTSANTCNPASPATLTITVEAQEPGTSGNLSAGAIMTWDSAAIGYLQTTMVVAAGGITGGTEDDTEEEVRGNLLAKLKAPAVGANWSAIRQWALESTSSVARAFVYPALRGPGSVDVAVIGEDGAVLSGAVLDEVAAYLESKLSEHVDLNVTAVAEQGVDLSFDMVLPLPSSAGGSGGGWVDAAPWPAAQHVRVTSQAGAVLLTSITTLTGLVAGQHIAIAKDSVVDDSHRYVIDSFQLNGGFTEITLTTVPTPDYVGCLISADAQNLETYVAAVADAMQALGPGEKSANVNVLPRGRRRPPVDQSDYQRVGHRLEAAVTDASDEVIQCRITASREEGTATSIAVPDVPSSPTDPPNRLTLSNVAFTYGT